MAQGKFSNFVNRLIAGKEKSEGYARASLPSNRWELFWDIVKGGFWKLVIINILTIIFFIPLFLLIFFRETGLTNLGGEYSFSLPFGIAYGAPLSFAGMAETITYNVNMIVFALLPIAMIFASIGLAGGVYVMRNMVWTEGIFVANDFWRGIKQNYKQILLITFIYSVIFYFSILGVSMANRVIAMGAENSWLFTIAKVISIIILVLYSVMTLHMITMSVTYELRFSELLKNSFLFTVGLPMHSAFFIVVGSIPIMLCFFGGVISGIGIALVLTFGLSLLLLVWTDFCHWIFDRYINVKIKGAKTNRGIYEKVGKEDSEALKKYREQIALASNSTLMSRPIKPITDEEIKLEELPTSFNRSDIEKLNASKEAMFEDNRRYVEEHMKEERYQKVEETKLDDEAERQKRIEKAKRELAKRNKNK